MAITSVQSTTLSQLVSQLMTLERKPIDNLKTQKDQLNVRRSVYSDTQNRLSTLKSLADDFAASGTVFGLKKATVSDTTVLTATAGASAANLTYSVSNITLAKAHVVASDAQGDPATPLGYSGTLLLGGAAARSTANVVLVDTTVTGLGTASALAAGERELASGAYYVEVQDSEGVKQFRVVDSQGQAVAVKVAGGTGMSSGWQALSTVASSTFDTGRGLTITFGDGSTVGTKGNGAAHLNYTAQGREVSVTAGQSLNDIQAAINNVTYAQDQAVGASIIQTSFGSYKLVLKAETEGTLHGVQAEDASGTVLQTLGVVNDPIIGGFKNEPQPATNATFTINGLQVTKNRNTGLTDVVGGLTISLLKETTSSVVLSVAPDSSAVKTKLQGFLDKFNDAVGYLRTKMAVDTTTYTRGPLAGDSIIFSLRMDLMTDMTSQVTGLSSGVPSSLAAVGITFDTTNMAIRVTDSAALDEALSANPAGMAELLGAVMTRVSTTLAPLVSSTGITQYNIKAIDDQKSMLDDRIKNLEALLPNKEAQYNGQYGAMLSQINELNSLQGMLDSMNTLVDYSA